MIRAVRYLLAALCAFVAVKADRFVVKNWPMAPESMVREWEPSASDWNAFDAAVVAQRALAARSTQERVKAQHSNWLIPKTPDVPAYAWQPPVAVQRTAQGHYVQHFLVRPTTDGGFEHRIVEGDDELMTFRREGWFDPNRIPR